MALEEYKRKRDFSKTPEPAGIPAARQQPGRLAYLIQKHAARRLHYDFRLELDGVLLSWAVPKGPSIDPDDRRLAVHVEDHPIEYGAFEGVIPAGEYGGGTVMLWDRGWWEPEGDPRKDYAKGHLRFTLHGEKLKGSWTLVRLDGRREGRGKDEWFLIKRRDAAAAVGHGTDVIDREDRSVASGRDMAAIAKDRDRMWSSTQGEIVAEGPASSISPRMLPLDPAKIRGAKRSKSIPEITPQLAAPTDHVPPGDEWLHEIKFDGYRMLAEIASGTVTLKTRTGLDWTDRFPGIVQAIGALGLGDSVLDGEIVHMLPSGVTSFSALQDDLSKGKARSLIYMVFDLLHLNGWNLTGARLEDRKEALAAILEGGEDTRLHYSDHQIGKGPEFFRAACGLGLEGIVSKRRDSPYRPGRNPIWLKAKGIAREDLIVVGFTDPAGARAGFGALLMGYYRPDGRLTYAGRVGTGFSADVLTTFQKRLVAIARKTAPVKLPEGLSSRGIHWVEPQIVVEITFAGWTSDDILRHSRFIGIREDKAPTEVVLDRPGAADSPASKTPSGPQEVARDGSAVIAGVRITHAERVVYPEKGITKLTVAEYYAEVSAFMLPQIADRPLSLLRHPDGLTGEGFFQKNLGPGFPREVGRFDVHEKDGTTTYAIVRDVKGLLGLIQMGVLEIHPWGSRTDDIERPDRLIFDLDPDEGVPWDRIVAAAITLRDRLADVGLRSFPKTTGGKGLHLTVPIVPDLEWDAAKAFTRALVETLEAEAPKLYTASMSKTARRGRIFIDYLRNGRGATAVAPYSTRARPSATVSAPLTWDEVESGIRGDHFTIENLPGRLRSLPSDPWAEMAGLRQRISATARKRFMR